MLTGNYKMHNKNRTILTVAAAVGLLASFNMAIAREPLDHMTVTGRTSQPIGHYEFCKLHPSDCRIISTSTRPTRLTRQLWNELVSVNEQVNQQVHPVTDMEYYKVEEYWTYPKRYGDCEDYVLLKRKELMELGWPASSVLITVVRQQDGDGHAVLTVRTDRADYILDNLNDRILPWDQTGYHYLKRQASYNSGMWEGIEDVRPTLVGSVKK